MAIIKCKMCGGDLQVIEGSTVCECEYCGTKQTVPTLDNEKKLTLFNRASRLLRNCEFDKASVVFETIVAEFPEEAEAYWGLVLCKYGIEYVDDPATGKKIPTCHRSSFDSVEDDTNFEQACENADAVARRLYREEARQIETLRKRIIEVSGKEEPYDIFISYKELDEDGERTIDSVIAQDIYKALANEGYRVFFSRISLEGKLGVEYEPYIFAALNSAKVMIVVGTDYDYFDAVWIKNEWSRFLKLIASGQQKALIPVYKDMDPYDMPKELRNLAAQDMGRIGAMQDLLHGVEKLARKKETIQKEELIKRITMQETVGVNITAFIKRGNMALQDEEWDKAKGFFDQALNIDAECADAYLGLVLAEAKACTPDDYERIYITNKTLRKDRNIRRIREFGNKELKLWLDSVMKAAENEDEKQKLRDEERKIQKEKQDAELQAIKRIKKYENEVRLRQIREQIAAAKDLIAVIGQYTYAIMPNGTIRVARGGEEIKCPWLADWNDIVQISGTIHMLIGVKADGRIVFYSQHTEDEQYNRVKSEVEKWHNIKKVVGTGLGVFGITKEGKVIAAGLDKAIIDYLTDIDNWTDIIDLSVGAGLIIGLKSDGKLVSTAYLKHRASLDFLSWSGIVAIYAASSTIYGLRSDGTVLSAGYDKDASKDQSLRDLVAITGVREDIFGLKADGTVVLHGNSDWLLPDKLRQLERWNNIVAIASSGYNDQYCVAGITNNGIVKWTASRVKDFELFNKKLFSSVSWIDKEYQSAREKVAKERQQRITELQEEKNKLHVEYRNLKGLFAGHRRKEIDIRIAAIDKELKKLEN